MAVEEVIEPGPVLGDRKLGSPFLPVRHRAAELLPCQLEGHGVEGGPHVVDSVADNRQEFHGHRLE